MSDIQDWFRSHRPQWKLRQPRAEQTLVPRPLFGEEDAATEWEHNLNPQQIFAHIASYDEFSSTGALFLFGRRGTGKTTLLHMLTHDVNTGGAAFKLYSSAVLLQPAVSELLPILRGARLAELEDTDLLSLLKLAWRWLIVSAAYIEVARKHPALRAKDSELALKINNALDDGTIGTDTTPYLVSELFLIFKIALSDIPPGANQLALTTIFLHEKLGSFSTRALEIQLTAAFKTQKRPSLVLVETEEIYRVDDRFASAIRSALIDSLLEIYNRSRHLGILAKAAFPSEIYPFLTPANVEKIENKLVFILWRYRDLVTFTAKRYYRLLNLTREPAKLDKELRSLEDFKNARKFLSRVLPSRITTRNNVELDAFSYILRHTQKKPRQLIAIFNCILTMAEDQGVDFDDLTNKVELVRDAVHSRLDTLVGGALDIYRGVYPGAIEIVKKSMTGMPCYFSPADLDKAIKETNEMRDFAISREDVRQLLVQAGVIGLSREVPRPLKKNEPASLMLEALFEYQVKGKLVVTGNCICVIHPMFYEELQIQIDSAVLAYPQPTEEEDELLQSLGWMR